MRDASTPKESSKRVFLVKPIWWNKTYAFLKIGFNKNVSNFVVYIIKFIWFNPRDTVLYPGLRLGTPVLCEDLIYLYKNNTLW